MLCSSSRWYTTAFRLGILITTFLIDDGACKNDKTSRDSSSPAAVNESASRHSHRNWGVWTSSDKTILPWDEQSQMPNIVPLSLDEHKLRQGKRKSASSSKHSRDKPGSQSLSDSPKKSREKEKARGSGHSKSDELAILREKALNFGSLVVDYLGKEVFAPSLAKDEISPRGFLSDISNSFTHIVQDRAEDAHGGGGGEDRGVIDWLARLIGVQGKTLGEFLREYQVHVLYDLVFTFFKWIFFLYAGLLIP